MFSPTLTHKVVGFIACIVAMTVMSDRGSAGAQPVKGTIPATLQAATAVVSVDTSNPKAVSSGFAGYNVALMDSGVEYPDPHLRDIAADMAIGWLRFPAGTRSDVFDWTTGEMPQAWVDQFMKTNQYTTLQNALEVLAGKGGDHFDDAADLARDIESVGLIVCINAFTDTPASAGQFAAYAKARGIKVLAWELANEPYYFPGFFTDATDYANQMKPYAESIKAADSSARIALFASDAGHESMAWDDALSAYTPRYWDLITYHQYPATLNNITDPATLMSLLNDVLVNDTNSYVASQIVPRFGAMPVIITEFDPSTGNGMYGLPSTLYGGVWAAEYALRFSSSGQVQRVGMHQLVNASGIELTNDHLREVLQAYAQGTTVDTTHLKFGYFKSAQAVPYAVASGAINSASHAYSTSVEGGSVVPLANGGTAPALYAQAYERSESRGFSLYATSVERTGWLDLVVTNKGPAQEAINIAVNGQAVWAPLTVTTATGAAGPNDVNTSSQTDVEVVTSVANTLVQIPPFSVVRVSWYGRADRQADH